MRVPELQTYAGQFPSKVIGSSILVNSDCLDWMQAMPDACVHGVVTDPPYGVKEYDIDQIEKRTNRSGGIWRIPPSFDGCKRAPLPRFTALNGKERERLQAFFKEWSKQIIRILVPGAHVFFASNSFISQLAFQAVVEGGLEFRGELIRLVRTMRGGDRPKNAEEEFQGVCSLPRGCYEPWGIFRKPMVKGMKVSDCLREFSTGGLRRMPDGLPFCDVIESERTPLNEKELADHPSLKPQSILRQLAWAVLPLGKGVVLDPFMGSGSTVAACESVGVIGVGVERSKDYFQIAEKAVPKLAKVPANRLFIQPSLF
jgi:site-specific DNA-methyltransferase (adenine-specific)